MCLKLIQLTENDRTKDQEGEKAAEEVKDDKT